MSREPPSIFAGFHSTLAGIWRSYVGLLRAWWRYKELVQELSSLTERELADTGLLRCHIHWSARAAAWDGRNANASPASKAEPKAAFNRSRIVNNRAAVRVGARWP